MDTKLCHDLADLGHRQSHRYIWWEDHSWIWRNLAQLAGVDVPFRMGPDDDDQGAAQTGVITRTKPKVTPPNLYKVLLLNDDFTPMEFVVHVIERFFHKNREEATQIMLHVHKSGVGLCGVFTYEVAETKVTQVMDFARRHRHPLQCVMEKD